LIVQVGLDVARAAAVSAAMFCVEDADALKAPLGEAA
jgi:hypothetical protein